MTNDAHWTERSTEDFLYSIASDFVEQLIREMKAKRITRAALAKSVQLSRARISQVFNNPGNLTLDTMVKLARALHLKVTIVAYDDKDPGNRRGPVNADMFLLCWKHANRPFDMWDVGDPCVATNS